MEPDSLLPEPSAPIVSVRSRLAVAAGTLAIARALLEAGRPVDLGGLDHEIGALCAGVVDLPPESGREFRPNLISILTACDAVSQALRAGRTP